MKWWNEKRREETGRKVNEVYNVWRRLSSRVTRWRSGGVGGWGGGGTLRDEIKLLWLSLSDMSSKKGCRLGGAVTDRLGCGTPLVSRCSPAFCPWVKRVEKTYVDCTIADIHMLNTQLWLASEVFFLHYRLLFHISSVYSLLDFDDFKLCKWWHLVAGRCYCLDDADSPAALQCVALHLFLLAKTFWVIKGSVSSSPTMNSNLFYRPADILASNFYQLPKRFSRW